MELITPTQRRILLKCTNPNIISYAADILLELKKRNLAYPWITYMKGWNGFQFQWYPCTVLAFVAENDIRIYYGTHVPPIWKSRNLNDVVTPIDILEDKIGYILESDSDD